MKNASYFRRIVSVLLILVVLVFSSPACAEKNVIDISASYSVWCDLYGITNFNDQPDAFTTSGGYHFLRTDNADILYNPDTFIAERLFFYCTSELAMENSDAVERLYAIISAIEYGKPDEKSLSSEKDKKLYMAKIKANVIGIADDLIECYEENKEALKNGETKSFYISENGYYNIYYSGSFGLVLYVYF